MQGSCADSLKMALAVLYERRHECPGAAPITCVHDEIVVECDEEDIDEAAAWLKNAMIDGMTEVLHERRTAGAAVSEVPAEVEIKSGKTWAG